MSAGPYRVEQVEPHIHLWKVVGPTESGTRYLYESTADPEAQKCNAAYAAGLAQGCADRTALVEALRAAPDFGGEPTTAFGHAYREWLNTARALLTRLGEQQ